MTSHTCPNGHTFINNDKRMTIFCYDCGLVGRSVTVGDRSVTAWITLGAYASDQEPDANATTLGAVSGAWKGPNL